MIAAIMGQEVVETARQVAYVKCAGTCEKTKDTHEYTGVEDREMMALAPVAVRSPVLWMPWF